MGKFLFLQGIYIFQTPKRSRTTFCSSLYIVIKSRSKTMFDLNIVRVLKNPWYIGFFFLKYYFRKVAKINSLNKTLLLEMMKKINNLLKIITK